MKVVKPSVVQERMATTRMRRLIAPTMVWAPLARACARATDGAGADRPGSPAVRRRATTTPRNKRAEGPRQPESGEERGGQGRAERDPDIAPGGEDGDAGGLAVARHRGGGAITLGMIGGHAEARDHHPRQHRPVRRRQPEKPEPQR